MQEPDNGQLELIGTDPNLTGGDVFKHGIITHRKTCRIIYYYYGHTAHAPLHNCYLAV